MPKYRLENCDYGNFSGEPPKCEKFEIYFETKEQAQKYIWDFVFAEIDEEVIKVGSKYINKNFVNVIVQKVNKFDVEYVFDSDNPSGWIASSTPLEKFKENYVLVK